jgi:hypothetical protein
MKFLGNFSDWVKPDILKYILNNPGQVRPGLEENKSSIQQVEEWKNIQVPGAKWSFHYEEVGISHLELPIPLQGKINWWFVKLDPSCVFPLHKDTFFDDSANVRRLWIPYQNYVRGHIFIYKDELVKDYMAGDIFEFDDPTADHGSSNISMIPKVSLQIVNYIN